MYPVTDEKKRLCRAAIEGLKYLEKALEEIAEGTSEATVCRKYNIGKTWFRKVLFSSQNPGFVYSPGDAADPRKWKDLGLLSWQERLYCSAMGETNALEIPPDIEESVEYVLDPENRFLKERESSVLRKRFEDGMRLEEIGKEYNVNRERIRQIEASALRKLRRQSTARIFILGVDCVKKIDEERAAVYKQRRDQEQEIVREWARKELDPDNIPIEDLDMSMRAFNCLNRAGYKTLGQLKGTTIEQLKEIRNLGEGTLQDIIKVAASFGIRFYSAESLDLQSVNTEALVKELGRRGFHAVDEDKSK